MLQMKLLKWSRKLHKWVGVYVSILTVVWFIEMVFLPIMFNPGLPVLDKKPAYKLTNNNTLSLKEALLFFIDQKPEGLSKTEKIDEMTYLPQQGMYKFAVNSEFLEWYTDADTGKIISYGFNQNRCLEQKTLLAWLNPLLPRYLNPYEFLFVFLTLSGCYIIFFPRRKKKKRTGSILDMASGESRYFKEISNTTLMSRLAAVGLLPGTEIKVIRCSNGKGPVVIGVRKTFLALGQDIAEQIMTSDTGN